MSAYKTFILCWGGYQAGKLVVLSLCLMQKEDGLYRFVCYAARTKEWLGKYFGVADSWTWHSICAHKNKLLDISINLVPWSRLSHSCRSVYLLFCPSRSIISSQDNLQRGLVSKCTGERSKTRGLNAIVSRQNSSLCIYRRLVYSFHLYLAKRPSLSIA